MVTVSNEFSIERIQRYLDDLISLEEGGVTALKDMVEDATDPQDAALFQSHLSETERQHELLLARLHALGGKPNALKGIFSKIGLAASDLLHLKEDSGDKATRNLLQAYTMESLEIASYESLIAAATEAGDTETAALAKTIQDEEKAAAAKIFARIDPMARTAIRAGMTNAGAATTAVVA